MKLNQTFISNIHEIYQEQGKLWLEQLPQTIMELCAQWGVEFIQPMANLSYHFVGVVKHHGKSQTSVIKLAREEKLIAREVKCLQSFSQSVPKIYVYDDKYHAVLMEHLQPGYSLKELVKIGRDDEATRIICQVLLSLQQVQHPTTEFTHVVELGKHLSVLENHVDKHLLSKAQSLFTDLSKDTKNIVLHGDLHHDNILASAANWKVIDPHGYMGDAAFEVGAMILNPFDCFPKNKSLPNIISRRLKILAEMLPFDAQRINAWAFCRTLLSVAWTYQDHEKIDEEEMEIARIINVTKK